VRTPQQEELTKALADAGGVTTAAGGDTLTVRGLSTDRVGDIAFEHGVRLHELIPARASLEAAFMELTADSVEYHAGVPARQAAEQAAQTEQTAPAEPAGPRITRGQI
jgi:ABC-2 type transport system ATP-binding protein